ncbi:MAG: Diadenosine hexaphosphate hydrolase [Firmicutes bacterium ADurb.Bin182]|nr:MAG: Diadenosine hexaphosphate hydrolase [Firmicutes bacterium ADurb.Bin182]
MLYRKCAGGVVFYENKVYLLKNEKDEWVLPKGVINQGMLSQEVAQLRVKAEAGIEAEVVCPAGETSYEFYSHTRKMPVSNDITWYVMAAKNAEHNPSASEGFKEGRYFSAEEAQKTATYSQDKALVRQAYAKLLQARRRG